MRPTAYASPDQCALLSQLIHEREVDPAMRGRLRATLRGRVTLDWANSVATWLVHQPTRVDVSPQVLAVTREGVFILA